MERPSNLVIRASAGTGKTFQLSNRFIDLLQRGEPVERVLASTFTRKAAGEILDRILYRLARAATDDAYRQELAECLERPTLDGAYCLDGAQCLGLLRQAVHHLHRMRIGTLDSFFAQIALTFSLELGLPPGWRICDELEDERLRNEAVEAVLSGNKKEQLQRLTHALAKGEARRGIHQLIRNCVDSLYELYLQTHDEAWQQIPKRKPLDAGELTASLEALRTAELPADKRFVAARDGDYERAVAGDWDVFITKGLAKPVLGGNAKYYGKPIPDDVAQIYERLLAQAKAEIVSRIALQTEGTHELLAQFHQHYQQLKTARGALRFEDVTHRLADRELAGGVDRLAFRLDSVVDHLLLDEFQDTSLTQWQVVRPFARQVTSSDRGSFFCVGDVKQAIYGWRGGIAEIFEALPDELSHLEFGSLNVSYRSAQPVIDAVNAVFANMIGHPNLDRAEAEVHRWAQRFTAHSTARKELEGYACLQTSPAPADDEKPADAVLKFAAEQTAQLTRQAPGCSVGMLVRTNHAVAKLIYLLRKLGVNASEEGGNPLTDSAAVRIVLSLLTLADHPGDTVARTRVTHSPLGKAMGLVETSDDATTTPLAQRVRSRLLEVGYGQAVEGWSRRLVPHCNRRELSRLTQLVELAYAYQGSATLRPSDFVQLVATQRVSDPTAADVRVMTVHQSKGLQFDVVILPDLDVDVVGQPDAFVVERATPTSPIDGVCLYVNEQARQLLPERFQKMFQTATDREVGESLCVLYVAMTRAEHALHMIVPPSKPSERKLRRTFSGLLRAALTDGDPAPAATTLYETGNPDWHQHVARPQPASTTSREPDGPAETLEVRLAPAKKRTRGLERTSPSALEGGSRVNINALLHSREKSAAALRGTLWHEWLEQIVWIEDKLPDDDQLRAIARRTPEITAAIDVEAQLRRFRDLLARPEILGVLSRRHYRPPSGLVLPDGLLDHPAAGGGGTRVQTERRFAIRQDDTLLNGSIDRLVLIGDGNRTLAADITDYKTDAIAPGDRSALNARVAYYRPQLAAYRRAVARFTRLPAGQIATRLVFLEPVEIVDL